MAGLDLFFLQLHLQRGARDCDVGKPAVLALPNGAMGKISQGIRRKDGEAAGAAAPA